MDTEEPKQLTTFGLVKPWNWGMDSTLAAEANIVAMESASEAARQIALEQLSVLHSIGASSLPPW
jgi:hypothetical protein